MRRTGYRLLGITAVLVAAWSLAVGQRSYPDLRQFTIADGLPSTEVYEVLQDRAGFIWVSTDEGICRFDGYSFEVFGAEDGLTDRVFFHLYEDHRGWIWAVSFKHNVFVYKGERFEAFPYNTLITTLYGDLASEDICWMSVSTDGSLVLALIKYGIVTISATGKCNKPAVGTKSQYILSDINHETRTTLQMTVPYGEKDSIQVMYKDSTSSLPLHKFARPENLNYSIYYYNQFSQPQTDTIVIQLKDEINFYSPTQHYPSLSRKYPDGIITFLLASDLTKHYYVGHLANGAGLRVYRNYQDFVHGRLPQATLLAGLTISHLLEDRDGGLWIATTEQGLFYLSNPHFSLNTIPQDSIPNPIVSSCKANQLFVRTKNQDIIALSLSTKKHSRVWQQSEDGFGREIHWDDRLARLWSASVLKYYNKDGQVQFYDKIQSSFTSDNLHPFEINYYSTTSNSKHLVAANTTVLYSAFIDSLPKLQFREIYNSTSNKRIFCIYQWSAERVLVGQMNGLFEVNIQPNSAVKQWSDHPALLDRINSISSWPDGRLAIGTKNNGVLIGRPGAWQALNTSNGLLANGISKVHIDQLGQLWIGTKAGLHRYQPGVAESMSYFTAQENLPSNEILDIDACEDDIWVTTKAGLVHFSLQTALQQAPKPVQFTTLQVNGADRSIDSIQHLKWSEKDLRVGLVALDYPQLGTIKYRYRLQPEEQWQFTEVPIISMLRLRPGAYELEVQSLGRNRQWSASSILPFKLPTPIWLRTWFVVLSILCLVGIVGMSIRNYYHRQNKALTLEQERERLAQQVTQLRQEAYNAQMNPHFVFNCLSAIQAFILSNEQDQLIASDYLSKFAHFTRQTLEAIQAPYIYLNEDLKILSNYIELEQFRFNHSFQYKLHCSAELDTNWLQIPAMIMQPYVENAILHALADKTGDGYLKVTYQLKDNDLVITVSDNGSGIAEIQSSKSHDFTSYGMTIAQRRIASLGGRVNIGSCPAQGGTLVTASIPTKSLADV